MYEIKYNKGERIDYDYIILPNYEHYSLRHRFQCSSYFIESLL